MSLNPKKFIIFTLIVVFSVAAAIFLAEQTLWHLQKKRRRVNLDYGDTLRRAGLGPGGYLKENLDTYVLGGPGKVRWRNNAAGFRRDQETAKQPPPGTLRILSLGDSFTAGYRIALEDTYSYLLEDWIKGHYGKAEVLISCIEEPATGLYYLEHFGSQFHPQVVLVGITLGNDIAQSYLALDPRGEFVLNPKPGKVLIERNPSKNKIGFHQGLEKSYIPADYLQTYGPLEEPIYWTRCWLKKLRLARALRPDAVAITSWYDAAVGPDKPHLFDANNGLGVYADPAPPEIQEAYRRLFRVLEGFQAFCEPRGILLAVLLFPQRFQVNPVDWDRAADRYGLKKSRFDLMAPNKKITAFCRERGIRCIDPTAAMAREFARTGTKFYYPLGDMHWNREGNRAFFAAAKPELASLVAAAWQRMQAGQSSGP